MTVQTIHKYGSLTSALGSASATIRLDHCALKQFIVKAPLTTTTFDVKLTDTNGLVVFEQLDNTGEMSETIDIPNFWNLTLTITNISANGTFTYGLYGFEAL